MITKFKLFENPDTVQYTKDGVITKVYHDDMNSYSFFYFSDSEYNKYEYDILQKKQDDIDYTEAKKTITYNITSDYGINDVYLSKDQIHPSSIYSLTGFYPDEEDFFKDKYINAGRFWTGNNIISFWDYPKSKSDLDKIIKDLNKQLNKIGKKEIDDTWVIEVINDEEKNSGKYNWTAKKDYSRIISIKDYNGSTNFPDEERILHLMKPEEKKKALMASGYRAKETKWKKHMKPFESKNYK